MHRIRAEPGKTRANTGKLERQMGFRTGRIFARTWEDGPFEALRWEVDPIIDQVSEAIESTELDISADARVRIERAFDRLAPNLWPSADTDRTAWLVEAASNNWDGLYPRDLYHNEKEDREILEDYFVAWIAEKCRTRARNLQHGLCKSKSGSGVAVERRPVKRAIHHPLGDDNDYEPPGPSRKRAKASDLEIAADETGSTGEPGDIAAPARLATIAAVYGPSDDDVSSLSSDRSDCTRSSVRCDARVSTTPMTTTRQGTVEPNDQACAITSLIRNISASPDSDVEDTWDEETALIPNPVCSRKASSIPQFEARGEDDATDMAQEQDESSRNASLAPHLDTRRDNETASVLHAQDGSSRNESTIPHLCPRGEDNTTSMLRNEDESSNYAEQLALFNAIHALSASSRSREPKVDLSRQTQGQMSPRDTEHGPTSALPSIEAPLRRSKSQERSAAAPFPYLAAESTSRQHSTGSAIAHTESSTGQHDNLGRATFRINWNTPSNWNVKLDVDDYAEMQNFPTVEAFFQLIEAHLPQEVAQFGGRIAQLKVQALEAGGDGPRLNCRILRGDGGRAAMKQMLKKLRARCEVAEPELEVEVVWA
ncbi:hypothetical protein CKM354_000192900 [Cercospora kikuchii]|uniref:Uncharacterized protein n=1 Tax=Cercospora kikuchii TaxID=84275 RepID=A0A9P3C908_9PEZI|nr:uncharacterized protein CKM354_000192900 [Cercospora kikuchii]GIZ38513.1 hypothetical protein CKM354_000192900 [Cercospora kikuchii]